MTVPSSNIVGIKGGVIIQGYLMVSGSYCNLFLLELTISTLVKTMDTPERTSTIATTQITQLNETVPGQHIYYPPAQAGPQYGIKVTGHATGCSTMGQSVPCNTAGGCSIDKGPFTNCIGSWMLPKNQNETASVHAYTTFGPLRAPGVYEFTCTYHMNIGMVGYLIVLPNKGYTATALFMLGESVQDNCQPVSSHLIRLRICLYLILTLIPHAIP